MVNVVLLIPSIFFNDIRIRSTTCKACIKRLETTFKRCSVGVDRTRGARQVQEAYHTNSVFAM